MIQPLDSGQSFAACPPRKGVRLPLPLYFRKGLSAIVFARTKAERRIIHGEGEGRVVGIPTEFPFMHWQWGHGGNPSGISLGAFDVAVLTVKDCEEICAGCGEEIII